MNYWEKASHEKRVDIVNAKPAKYSLYDHFAALEVKYISHQYSSVFPLS